MLSAAASSVHDEAVLSCILYTCDYLYLDKEIYFAKPLKMSEPGAGRKLMEHEQC